MLAKTWARPPLQTLQENPDETKCKGGGGGNGGVGVPSLYGLLYLSTPCRPVMWALEPCDSGSLLPTSVWPQKHPNCGRSHWCGSGWGHIIMANFLEEVGFALSLKEGCRETR